MKLLTDWMTWWDNSRKENKFHCDLILEPGDLIFIRSVDVKGDGEAKLITPPPGEYAKVHLSASWEFRSTEFVEG